MDVLNLAGEQPQFVAELAQNRSFGRDRHGCAAGGGVFPHGDGGAQYIAVAIEGEVLILDPQDLGAFRPLEGGDQHNIRLAAGDVRHIFRVVRIVTDQEPEPDPVHRNDVRTAELAGVCLIQQIDIPFRAGQMLFVEMSRLVSLPVKDSRGVAEHTFFRLAHIVDRYDGVAAACRFLCGRQQFVRELFCVRDAGAFFKVGGSVGVFRSQDDVAGFITLFELFDGEPDGCITICLIVGEGDLERTKFHTVFPHVD